MTHTTTVVDETVQGDKDVVFADVDITSLGAAGAESFDADAAFGMHSVDGVTVVGQENAGYQFTWDHVNSQIAVTYGDYSATADGTHAPVPSATDVGVVRLKFEGR